MRVLALLLAGPRAAAVAVRAQTPPRGIRPRRRPRGPALDLPGNDLRPDRRPPSRLPPAGSGPLLHAIMLCFEKQGGSPVVEANTYLYYMQLKGSQPSIDTWVPYDDTAQQMAIADFKRLWATNFLDDLVIEVHDVRYANGVPGKVVVYSMEERQRVKIVDYVGPKKVDQTKIEEELKKQNITIKLDSFIDPGLIRKVSGVVRDVYAEKGYQFVEVKPEIKPVEGGTKIVNVTFHITEGPKVKIRYVDFVGNSAVSDGKLSRQPEGEQGPGDVLVRPRQRHLQRRQVRRGRRPRRRVLPRPGLHRRPRGAAGSEDPRGLEGQKTRWVQLRIPITEGKRYRVGKIDFEGNKIVNAEALRPLFKAQGRGRLQREEDPQGLREGQGSVRRRRIHGVHRVSGSAAARPAGNDQRCRRGGRPLTGAGARRGADRSADRRRDAADPGRQAVLRQPHHVRRQHDDARSGHPARGAAPRERHLQHRSAEVQHQAAEPARLLQAARRRGDRRRQDARAPTTRSTSS